MPNGRRLGIPPERIPGIADTPVHPENAGNAGNASILVLCHANVCRSPMAASLLARRLAVLGVAVPVRSAGMYRAGDPPHPEVVSVLADYQVDAAAHRSTVASAADLSRTILVLGMTRENLRYAVVTEPGTWPRAFTLKELVRRGDRIGPRPPGEPLAGWLARAHAGRDQASLLGYSLEDDVPDPAGGPLRGYADTAALLDRLVARLIDLAWANARPTPCLHPPTCE
jgi:protein-tyrosine phosphatase